MGQFGLMGRADSKGRDGRCMKPTAEGAQVSSATSDRPAKAGRKPERTEPSVSSATFAEARPNSSD